MRLPARRGSRFGRLLAATGAARLRRIEACWSSPPSARQCVAAALRRDSWRRPVRVVFLNSLHRVAVESAMTTTRHRRRAGLRPGDPGGLLAADGGAEPAGRRDRRALLVREIAPVVVGFIIFGRVGTRILIDLGEARPRGLAAPARAAGHRSDRAARDAAHDRACDRRLLPRHHPADLDPGHRISWWRRRWGWSTFPIWQFGQNVTAARWTSPTSSCRRSSA